MNRINSILTMLLASIFSLNVFAASVDIETSAGDVRVHIPDNSPSECDAILIGVGTAMSAFSYDTLSAKFNSYGYITVILDHQPGELTKTDANRYKALAEEVKLNLLDWVSNSNCTSIEHWVMGGHSAGGQAAQNAVGNNPGLADAVFSIDPYDISGAASVDVPALYWGFDFTTCFVDKDKAAKAAYYKSTAQRAFVKVKRKYSFGPCGFSPKYFHCSFCDGHCPACTNCQTTPGHFFDDVGSSVKKFIDAAFYGNWSKTALTFGSTTPITLYVDTDQP